MSEEHDEAPTPTEPSADELVEALGSVVDADGLVPAGVVGPLTRARGWSGRVVDVLHVLTADAETMGYLAGGRRPGEVVTWAEMWADTPLGLGEIKAIVSSGGWDPEPFVAVSRAGLLEALLHLEDGTPRRVGGELAGAWVSDQFALADEAQTVAAVEALLSAEGAPSTGVPGREG